MQLIEVIEQTIEFIKAEEFLSAKQITKAKEFIYNEEVVLLTTSKTIVTIGVGENYILLEYNDQDEGDEYIIPIKKMDKAIDWDEYSFAALLVLRDNLNWFDKHGTSKKYTRAGMIKRVMMERHDKAKSLEYKVKLGKSIYGEHTLKDDIGNVHLVTLWDFDQKTGYINNIDWKTNKLGTTKHIMFLFDYLEEHPKKLKRLKKAFPFIDVSLDPLNDYKISYKAPDEINEETKPFLEKYFGKNNVIDDTQMIHFVRFLLEANQYDDIIIRSEVNAKLERFFNKNHLQQVKEGYEIDYSVIKADLFDYQKKGVEFALFREGVIIADEMGLGKTIQAITTAILKKDVFGFKKTLVICPASIKHQWKAEIEKFSNEKALVIEGFPLERKEMYLSDDAYFYIINYETVLRDLQAINDGGFDFVILDEAQRIKNYETKTASAIKKIKRKHALVITGTPIENKLIDLYSIMLFVDKYFMTPLWEFSYQHCLFDHNSKNRIAGYYDLNLLKEKMKEVLIRREKRVVLKELPSISEEDIYVSLHPEQIDLHKSYKAGVSRIIHKKFKTTFDWQMLMLLLTKMRMVCDSVYLIDKKTNTSPKLIELEEILIEKLDLKNNNRKVIIFSEWTVMLSLIGDLLTKLDLGYTKLTGKVPVKKRGELIKNFETDDNCQIFLSSEAGGSGLNLQMADTVINFELPWNPAKKNQRIGRIDRLGQRSEKLTVFNLISVGSIEQEIATGLLMKQNLFDGVLNDEYSIDSVDFSKEGRSQFIKQLEDFVEEEPIIDYEIDNKAQETNDIEEEILVQEISIVEDEIIEIKPERENNITPSQNKVSTQDEERYVEMEKVMNKGMDFLSGIYQMSTGKSLSKDGGHKVEVNRETGEVVMRFKF